MWTLDLLAHFGHPRTTSSWLTRWPAEHQNAAEGVFGLALTRGLLVAADPVGDMDGGTDGSTGDHTDDGTAEMVQTLFVELDRLRAHLRSADGTVLSEVLGSDQALPRLVLHTSHLLVRDVADRLEAGMRERLRTQARAIASSGDPLRLHLGCGPHRLPGWVNVDLRDPAADLRLDVRAGLPFDDGAAVAVYLAHILEHVEYPDEARRVLRECCRTLGDGGLLRVAVPDLCSFLDAYAAGDDGFFEYFERRWEREPAPTPLASFLHHAGAGEFPWVADRHRFGYDERTLGELLRDAGFTDVRRCSAGDTSLADPNLDYSWANGAAVRGRPFSLIMEAKVVRQ
ncbi:class I SAM-dependent methyltransferase [Parafrankia sp. FMc2]|uniref:class I SAM-dependent methyltransferase n=1 Tax=Parafrankia sp. FMc2 TaxID=3233196 RepID=UPI0034D514D3